MAEVFGYEKVSGPALTGNQTHTVVAYANKYYRAYAMQEPGKLWRELRPIRCLTCGADCTSETTRPPESATEPWFCTQQCAITAAFNDLLWRGKQ